MSLFKLSNLSNFKYSNTFVKSLLTSRYYTQQSSNVHTFDTIRNVYQYGEALNDDNKLFKIQGWIRGKIQKKKTKWFLQLDDGSTHKRLQMVIPTSLLLDDDHKHRIQNGISVECVGFIRQSIGPQQPIEFECQNFTIIGDCKSDDYIIGHLKTGKEFDLLRDQQIHLRPRVKYFQSLIRIRNELSRSIHQFMYENQFIKIDVPSITTNDCEGGGECFQIQPLINPVNNENNKIKKYYFNRPTYLTVSGQLHLEAMVSSFKRVYCLSNVFRAEKSMSPKHLSEFIMLELEQAFLNDLDQLIDLVESLFRYLVNDIERNCSDDLEYLLEQNQHKNLYEKFKLKFHRITYDDALQLLSRNYPELIKSNNDDNKIINLNAQMERALLEQFNNEPIFVTKFPMKLKPFYMKTTDDGNYADCFDLLTPICGEVCGGSLRENNYEQLHQQICAKNSDQNQQKQLIKQLEWYLDLRKFGPVPTGGFGLGFDRFIQTITGVTNIKDVVPFPRWPYHCCL